MTLPPHLPGSYLVIELANRCSLACVHCAVADETHAHFDGTGYLDVAIAEGLFSDLVASGIRFDTLILFWLGEPLLHPEFGRIWQAALRTAAEHGTFGKVELHTNATHLTERVSRTVLNRSAVPQVMHFSLDADDRDTYTRIKGRDRFVEVVDNIEGFLRRKAALGASAPRPVFQYIVGSNNVDEVGAFRSRWEGFCQQVGIPVRTAAGHVPKGEDAVVFFRQLDCPTPEEQERENAVFRDAMKAQGLTLPEAVVEGETVRAANHTVCSGFWKSPVIDWRGNLTTCTRDSELHNRVGSLTETLFSELWFGELMRHRRNRVSEGDYSGMSVCETCFIPRSLNYTGIDADEIAQVARFESAS